MNLMRLAADRFGRIARLLDDIDPGGRRRVRGLRLVASFAMASMAGTLAMPGPGSLAASACAGNFAIWACVYEAAATREQACIDLLALIGASALGCAMTAVWSGLAGNADSAVAMLPLAGGAFLVDYAKRYGPLAALLTRARDQAADSLAWAGGRAVPRPTAGADMLAEVEAQKTRFAGLRFEGILTHDGDSGALLLLRIDALVETTIRLMEEARLAQEHNDPGLSGSIAGSEAQLRLAFDPVLARLHRQGRPPMPPSDAVLPPLRAYVAEAGAGADAATCVLLAAALTYTGRKIIRTLADIAAELDRRDGAIPQPIAR